VAVEPSTAQVRGIAAPGLAELRRLRGVAESAPAGEREARWYDVARFALERAASAFPATGPDAPEVASALREACSRLPAATLAAVAVRGRHPTVSEAFCRALRRERGPNGVTGAAEAAAEARDAIATFGGGKPARPFLDLLRDDVEAAPGAGGTQRSVYSILVLGSERDSASSEFRLARGLEAGVQAAAGAWTPRFQVVATGGDVDAAGAALNTIRTIRDWPAGVIVSVGNAAGWTAVSTLGMAEGQVAIDARGPGEVGFEDAWPFGEVVSDREREARNRMLMFGLTSDLAYARRVTDDRSGERFFRPFLVRPTPTERARRLAEMIARRPEIRRVAVALPGSGGDMILASSFLGAMRGLGREAELLIYEPGRRDYAPEAARFVATGAQAILLAGPGEESAEWLGALMARKAKPLVLGTTELDPAGFHAGQRGRLEGAILAGEDWDDRNPGLVERLGRTAGDAADDPAFRRGYRLGWVLARAVVEGAYTPSSLRLALEQRSLPRTMATFTSVLVGIDQTGATVPTELVLPLFTIKNGVRVPLDSELR
jgi:hypothetical protein